MNEEKQIMRMTGIIRQQDVDARNTVDSSDVADLHLEYIGKGPISDASKRGVIQKVFDLIWPF